MSSQAWTAARTSSPPTGPAGTGSPAPRDLAGNADAALAALDGRGAGRAVVVGHSLGAAVAAWLAATRPDRVAALVLAAPAANLAALYALDRWLAAPVAGDLAAAAALGGLGLALAIAPVRRRIAGATRLDEAYLRTAGAAVRRPGALARLRRRAAHARARPTRARTPPARNQRPHDDHRRPA